MMRRPTVHIVGAGFSGLSAAVHLSAESQAQIVIHQRGAQAGGRRRAFYDEALGMTIDSGNYFLLPSWRSTIATLDLIGARAQWREEPTADLPFADMATGERWTLKPNAGKIPWWTLVSGRRAPRTELGDYLSFRKLRSARASAVVADFAPGGPASERLWRPFTLAALNVDPLRASARLAGAMYAETVAPGGRGARLMFPVGDFARAFVEPALKYLRRREVSVRFERNLQALDFAGDRVAALDFEQDRIDLSPGDAVILAVPPTIASALAPGLSAPNEFTATLTAHFAVQPPVGAPRVQGVVNGPFHWLFCYPDRICAGARDAGALMEEPREKLAAEFWRAAAGLTGLSDTLPAWRIIRQKRAAFAATPAQDALRPACQTHWRNLFLAGAYVQNGLPETLESAVRSGKVAAKSVLSREGAEIEPRHR
jgi:squalene-associated FAD-dependent desaturase